MTTYNMLFALLVEHSLVHWYQQCVICISCHKAIVVITGRAHCFHDCIYIYTLYIYIHPYILYTYIHIYIYSEYSEPNLVQPMSTRGNTSTQKILWLVFCNWVTLRPPAVTLYLSFIFTLLAVFILISAYYLLQSLSLTLFQIYSLLNQEIWSGIGRYIWHPPLYK